MAIAFELTDVFTTEERTALKGVLSARTDAELEAAVTNLSKASLREFADAILGLYPGRLGSDISERRLLHLIRFHFGNRIPTEIELVQMLRITESNATKLLRDLSAHQPGLADAYAATLQDLFDAKVANVDGATHHVTIVSKHLVEWLKGKATVVAPNLGAITRVRGTNDRHAIPIDTYNAICDSLRIRR